MPNPGATPAPAPPAEKRQPRQSRLAKAALGCQRLGRFDITIRNVSETGVGGQGPLPLNIGERVTLYLAGHQPMLGTVRWVQGTRFGIETDRVIETIRLRAAHADQLVAADSSIEFQIIPPPRDTSWRPGLKLGAAKPAHFGRSVWTNKKH